MTWQPATPSPSERDPRRLGESLRRFTEKVGAPPPSVLNRVFGHWEELVGAELAAHAAPLSLRDGVLILGLEDPAWGTHLSFVAPQILELLAREVGPGAVREIQWKVRPSPRWTGRRRRRPDTPSW